MGYVDVYGKIFNINLITASHHTHKLLSGFDVMIVVVGISFYIIQKLKEPIFYKGKLHLPTYFLEEKKIQLSCSYVWEKFLEQKNLGTVAKQTQLK